MRYMERDPFGYHYPAGTPAPRTEYVLAFCETCGFKREGELIHDLGTVDLVVKGVGLEGACPNCGYDAPPLQTTRTGQPTRDDYRDW